MEIDELDEAALSYIDALEQQHSSASRSSAPSKVKQRSIGTRQLELTSTQQQQSYHNHQHHQHLHLHQTPNQHQHDGRGDATEARETQSRLKQQKYEHQIAELKRQVEEQEEGKRLAEADALAQRRKLETLQASKANADVAVQAQLTPVDQWCKRKPSAPAFTEDNTHTADALPTHGAWDQHSRPPINAHGDGNSSSHHHQQYYAHDRDEQRASHQHGSAKPPAAFLSTFRQYSLCWPTQESAYSSLIACEAGALDTIAACASRLHRKSTCSLSEQRLVGTQQAHSATRTAHLCSRANASFRHLAAGTVSLHGVISDLTALASAALSDEQPPECSSACRACAHLLTFRSSTEMNAAYTHESRSNWSFVPEEQVDKVAQEFTQCARYADSSSITNDCLNTVYACLNAIEGNCSAAVSELREMFLKGEAAQECMPMLLRVLAAGEPAAENATSDVIHNAYACWEANIGRESALLLLAQGSSHLGWSHCEALLRNAQEVGPGSEQRMSVHLATIGIRDGCIGQRMQTGFTENDITARYKCEKIADGLTGSKDRMTRRTARWLGQRLRDVDAK